MEFIGCPLSVNDWAKANKKLERLITEDKIYWKQRSREDWLALGDKNTSWFHFRASSRKRKNKIAGLQNDCGDWISDLGGLGNLITNNFSSIFSSSGPSIMDIHKVLDCSSPSVSLENNASLPRSFTYAEVERMVKSMHPHKAPVLTKFMRPFSMITRLSLGGDVFKICLRFLNDQVSLGDLNHTFLALIPKIKDPKTPQDFCPISLCNVVYKIISIFLTNCLKKVLDDIISPNQYAFILGHLITNNVLIWFEGLHAIKNKCQGKEGIVA